MPQIVNETKDDFADCIEEQADRMQMRQQLTAALDTIAIEVTAKLAAAGILIPVFLTVPQAGGSLLTIATPLDPSDEIWGHACSIIRDIVCNVVGLPALYTREIACIAAGTQVMGAAEIITVIKPF